MGLMTPKESSPDLAALAWDFRLGLKHAERMNQMAYPVDQRYGLALKFADFSLLPELLALVPDSGGRDVPDSWRELPAGRKS